jgi:hypothetical protein
MTAADKDMAVAAGKDLPIVKRLLNSMWFYWMFLLAISLGIAAAIYLIWLRGTV